jgi:hypothetical protein
MPMWAVLDEQRREAIALCWHEDKAREIADALNGKGAPANLHSQRQGR